MASIRIYATLAHEEYCQNRQEQRRKIERDQSTIDEILSLPQIGWTESFLEKEALISKMKVQSTIVVYKMCYVEEINMFTCTYLYCYQYIVSL